MNQGARILLADDHTLVRRGVRLILDSEPGLRVVAEAEDGAEAVAICRARDIDLAILDVAIPTMTGLQAAREISDRREHPRILMLSMHDHEQYFFESLKAGACGYVLKSVADQDLIQACHAALCGASFLYPAVTKALLRNYLERGFVPGTVLEHRGEELVETDREVVLDLLLERRGEPCPRPC